MATVRGQVKERVWEHDSWQYVVTRKSALRWRGYVWDVDRVPFPTEPQVLKLHAAGLTAKGCYHRLRRKVAALGMTP